MPKIDMSNIQGNILRGYRLSVSSYFFLTIEDPIRARAWIAGISPHVTNAEPWQDKPTSTVNIGFSFAGLKALGLSPTVLGSFSPEFQDGMALRAPLLGDTGESAPESWEEGFRSGGIHVMIVFNALHQATLNEKLRWFQELLDRCGGLKRVHRIDGAPLPESREHFGYRDGISQPSIAGIGSPLPGQGTLQEDGSWKPLNLGEFVFGYKDEEGILPDAPQPDILGHNGTYLVFRKLHQNVGLFRQFLKKEAAVFPGGEELLSAKLVGRWRDGTPLVTSPEHPDPNLMLDKNRNNDFGYSSDPDGMRCPMGSHVRRVNPRDGGIGLIANRHRMIRRGVPYGPPLPPDDIQDDGQDRGLLFVSMHSDIARQFEFVQRQWMNDGNIFHLGNDKDIFTGAHAGDDKMTIQGRPPCFLSPMKNFVTLRGGEYFFMPGINALDWLAHLQ